MAAAKRAGRAPKQTDPVIVASVLAFGDLHDDEQAAKQFSTSTRTIQRWRAAVRDGRMPEVAALVAEQKGRALAKQGDLLAETFALSLKELQVKLASGNLRQVVGAVSVVGRLVSEREFLKDDPDVEQPGVHPAHAGTEGPARRAAGGAGRTPSPPSDPSDSVH